MLSSDALPKFGRTMGKLCAFRRIADSLLSELEQEHSLVDARCKLKRARNEDKFGDDLSSEIKDDKVLEYVEKYDRKAVQGGYDTEMDLFVQKIDAILDSKNKSNQNNG